LWVNNSFFNIVSILVLLENGNYAAGDTFGLEKIGGLREVENLRGPFIISLRVQKMSGEEPVNKC